MKPFHLCLLHGFSLITILDIFNSPKKPDVSEQGIRLNEERFERTLKSLSSISKHLKAQLQRKTLILGNYFHITWNTNSHGGVYSEEKTMCTVILDDRVGSDLSI